MESPVAIVKSAINPGRILGWMAAAFVGFFILDAAGVTNYILFPFTTLKQKFGK